MRVIGQLVPQVGGRVEDGRQHLHLLFGDFFVGARVVVVKDEVLDRLVVLDAELDEKGLLDLHVIHQSAASQSRFFQGEPIIRLVYVSVSLLVYVRAEGCQVGLSEAKYGMFGLFFLNVWPRNF